ncbi:MAG TPA: hypothetical protein VJ456_18405 [Acidimicrobiia bacterium]|nr:hypothetical protein [Acidimicrobiia bacterium]HMC80523.1 hypothetical protein [Acidimicrobiia bacterium]HTC82216.1 hypothetical protein [Acidimicrobiia bacterium]
MGLVEFAAGWALGAKSGETHFEEVVETGKSVLHSQEVADLVHAVRAHVGYSLKALGGLVMGDESEPSGDDLLDIVRQLMQRREGSGGQGGPTPPLQVVRDIFRDRRGAG